MKALMRWLKLGPRCPHCGDRPMTRVVTRGPKPKWYIPGERRHHCGECGTRLRHSSGRGAYWSWFLAMPALGLTGITKAIREAGGDYAFYAVATVWVAGCVVLWSRILWEDYFDTPRGMPPAEAFMEENGADLGYEAYRLMERVHFRITPEEAVAQLLALHPSVAEEKLRAVVARAKALRRIALDGNFYDEPTARACEARAWSRFHKEAPGLSKALYNHVLHQIMYSWMK